VKPESLIAAALRHENAPWPTDAPPNFEASFLGAAAEHGVTPLLSLAPAMQSWPRGVQSAIARRYREGAAREIIRHDEIMQVLSALAEAGVSVLLLKGAGIAYTHYPQPWLRPRLDTDLLVAPDDRGRATVTLERLGYEPLTHFDGELVTYQSQLKRVGRSGVIDRLDLHWRVANPQVFADVLTFVELTRDAAPIAALGPTARTLSPAHALLLACVHRVAHHANSDRLIWLYDIRLVVERMSPAELECAAAMGASKNLQPVIAAGLTRASAVFPLGAKNPGIDRLLQPAGHDVRAITEFLREDRTKVHDLVSDLRALQGWRPRLRLIREHLLPPAAYLRRVYRFSNPLFLPFAYALRVLSGAVRWFRPER
jgi:hypothetical protein